MKQQPATQPSLLIAAILAILPSNPSNPSLAAETSENLALRATASASSECDRAYRPQTAIDGDIPSAIVSPVDGMGFYGPMPVRETQRPPQLAQPAAQIAALPEDGRVSGAWATMFIAGRLQLFRRSVRSA